jgi:MFS family permease
VLLRFSLYGFLKNQRYFEPFIVLFFLDHGLSFLQIGWLVAQRELFVNILEIPSGAMADTQGRRRIMIASFVAYIVSFLLFATGTRYLQFAAAMLFFAVGDAFRTGTHKAMIFAWLRHEGRLDEKTKVYGITRSWSKIGSAVSIVLATLFVLKTHNYAMVFYLATIPYALGILNFLSYPDWLDGSRDASTPRPSLMGHLRETLGVVRREKQLRRLILESMTFEGMFKSGKDYLQPLLRQAVVGLPLLATLDADTRSTLLIGAVYLLLYLLSAAASRRAHHLVRCTGGENRAIALIWVISLAIYTTLTPALYQGWMTVAILLFVLLHILQNYFRPIQISRFDAYSDESQGATVLSVESQAKTLSTMALAPLLGFCVDLLVKQGVDRPYWPVGLLGAVLTGVMLLTMRGMMKRSQSPDV